MVAKELGIPLCDCYVIGDSEVDVLTAQNSHMHSVAVSWGFRERDALNGAEIIADSPSELKAYFKL